MYSALLKATPGTNTVTLRMSDVSPCRTDSQASRQIVFCLPVSAYALDEGHVNWTLQLLLEAMVDDLKALSTTGVPSRDYGVAWFLIRKSANSSGV